MTLKLNVPTLNSPEQIETITEAIKTVDPTAKVDVDVTAKLVSVDPQDPNTPVASGESIKQAISATGHTIA